MKSLNYDEDVTIVDASIKAEMAFEKDWTIVYNEEANKVSNEKTRKRIFKNQTNQN